MIYGTVGYTNAKPCVDLDYGQYFYTQKKPTKTIFELALVKLATNIW